MIDSDNWSRLDVDVQAGVELNRPRLNVSQPQVSGDCQEMNLHFDTGKKRSDAVPRARGKRDRRQPMPMF
jgi:hypothetical protein